MERNATLLIDEHLESLIGMKEAVTDDFFYTRLKARMDRQSGATVWNFPLKPVWVVSTLFVLLAVNGFMLSQKLEGKKEKATASAPTLQGFAESYDQVISSSY
jgi:hypothetical protein